MTDAKWTDDTVKSTIAEMISRGLSWGLQHPGYPNTEQPAVVIHLPFRPGAGAATPEMAAQINETAKMIGEAIVYVITTEGNVELVLRDELEALKAELAQLKAAKR